MPLNLLQLSEHDKLALVGAPTFKVIGSLVVATVFWGLQEMAEIGCQCPWLVAYNQVYGISFLLVPAAVLTLLSVFVHRECLVYCRCPRRAVAKCTDHHLATVSDPRRQRPASWQLIPFLKIFYHGWMWIMVVLLDGDCYCCIHYFSRLAPGQAAPETPLTAQPQEPPKEDSEIIRTLKFESRMTGLTLLLVLVTIAVCISCCHVSRCWGKPYYWWEYQQMYLEETERIVLSTLKESASRKAERNYKSETTSDLFPGAVWEHISSGGFAKIEYPEDFRVAPGEDDPGSRTDGEPAVTALGEQRDDCSTPEEQGLGSRSRPDETSESGESALCSNSQPGAEDSGKAGWKSRLQGAFGGMRKHLRRAARRVLKTSQGTKGKGKESGSRK